MVIALFRHGITEENKRKAYLGWTDSPLSCESMKIKTKKRYDIYFSSDLNRCVTTANILFPKEEIIPLENLREMNFGLWEGKTYEELKSVQLYRDWLTDPLKTAPPEGESFTRFSNRIDVEWKRITEHLLSNHYKNCGIVTHGGVIRYLLSKLAPKHKEFWDWPTPFHQGFELIFDKDTLRRGERCTLLREVPLTEKKNGS
nr:histidine phosphatase family protein [Neobacillus sp. Marseille-Q6967]